MVIDNKLKKRMIELKKKGWHISDISKNLGVSDRSVNKYSKNIPHPYRRSIIKLSASSKKFSLEKAEILGYLCSEGNYNSYFDRGTWFDKRRGKRYRSNVYKESIDFSNTNKIIQNRFIYLMGFVYKYPLKVFKNGSSHIKRKEVVRDLKSYSSFGARKWQVPKILALKKYKKHALRFLRAYCDGDGTVTESSIRIDSVNPISLKKLNLLLNKLGFRSYYNSYPSRNRITIKDTKNYQKFVGFLHPEKKEKLKRIINKTYVR